MNIFEVDKHESSFLPDGNWKMVWNDEFLVDYIRVFEKTVS